MHVESYRELIVWQKSMKLAKAVYRLASLLPKEEVYGLASQIKRCAVSIPSNIAEGSRRGTSRDYKYFLCIAFGSGAELETQLELCIDIFHIPEREFSEALGLLDEIMKMLNSLTNAIS